MFTSSVYYILTLWYIQSYLQSIYMTKYHNILTYLFFLQIYLPHIKQIIHITCNITYSKNDASWKWSFEYLKETYSQRNGMCIDSIVEAAAAIYSIVLNCICIFHLWDNVKDKFKKIQKISKKYTTHCQEHTLFKNLTVYGALGLKSNILPSLIWRNSNSSFTLNQWGNKPRSNMTHP